MAAVVYMVCVLSSASCASAGRTMSTTSFFEIVGTLDSTSGVLVNRSFAHPGIVTVMRATSGTAHYYSGGLRYPGAPAVASAFDPVRVRGHWRWAGCKYPECPLLTPPARFFCIHTHPHTHRASTICPRMHQAPSSTSRNARRPLTRRTRQHSRWTPTCLQGT